MQGCKIYRLAQYYSCFMRRIQDGCTSAWIYVHLVNLILIGIFSITELLHSEHTIVFRIMRVFRSSSGRYRDTFVVSVTD